MNRILFISYSGSFPPIDGKRQRTLALLQALSSRYLVDYLILDNIEDFRLAQKENNSDRIQFKFLAVPRTWKEDFLHRLGLIFIPSAALRNQIKNLCIEGQYQFVFSRYIHPVILLPKSLPVVADIDDDLEENYRSRIATSGSWIQKLRLSQVLWLNLWIYKRLLKRLSIGFTVKAEQGRESLKHLPNLPFQLLRQGHIPFVSFTDPKILFVGKLTYPPNLSGIKWFIREVFPLVLNHLSQASLTLISNLPVQDRELEELVSKYPSIQVLINVEDLVEVYQQHSVAVAPILEGAGSNIKIAESLWMGRPVIASPFGTRGFEMAKGGSFLLEGFTAEHFGKQVVNLLLNQESLKNTQIEAYQFGQREFSLNRWSDQFLNDLEHVS